MPISHDTYERVKDALGFTDEEMAVFQKKMRRDLTGPIQLIFKTTVALIRKADEPPEILDELSHKLYLFTTLGMSYHFVQIFDDDPDWREKIIDTKRQFFEAAEDLKKLTNAIRYKDKKNVQPKTP